MVGAIYRSARRPSIGVLAIALLLVGVVGSASTLDALATGTTYGLAVGGTLGVSNYIAMDDGSGTTAAATIGGTAATCIGGSCGWSASGFVAGSAHSYNGDNGTTAWTWGSVGGGAGHSFEVWFAGTATVSHAQYLLSIQNETSGTVAHELVLNIAASTFNFSIGDTTAGVACNSGGANPNFGDGNPHMFSGTDAAGVMKLYDDGVLCGTSSAGDTSIWSSNFTALALHGSTGHYTDPLTTGNRMGQVSVYSSVMSATTIASHWAARTSTPSTLYVNPPSLQLQPGHMAEFVLHSTDAGGTDTTAGDTFTFASTSPSGGMTCGSFTGQSVICTAGSVLGRYTLTWHSSGGALTAHSFLQVVGTAATFQVLPNPATMIAGTSIDFAGYSQDASGNDTSAADAWAFVSPPSAVSCQASGLSIGPAAGNVVTCASDTPGVYTLNAEDAAGLFVSVQLTVSAAPAPSVASCHSGDFLNDAVCWLQVAVTTLANLVFSLVRGIYDLLFVSKAGHYGIDFTTIGADILPQRACASGQAPTSPDGIHCLPFPLSIPWDIVVIFAQVLGGTPTSPSFPVDWDEYAGGFHVVNWHTTIAITTILPDALMEKVRNVEFVIFVVIVVSKTRELLAIWERFFQ
jgi:hypothetical protein